MPPKKGGQKAAQKGKRQTRAQKQQAEAAEAAAAEAAAAEAPAAPAATAATAVAAPSTPKESEPSEPLADGWKAGVGRPANRAAQIKLRLPLEYFGPGKDITILVALPSLEDFPEDLTEAVLKQIAKSKDVEPWQLQYPQNFNFLAMNEVRVGINKFLRRDWWDMAPDAFKPVDLPPRQPTPAEVATLDSSFVGKRWPVDLYYRLAASGGNNAILAEIMGFKAAKLSQLHVITVGKYSLIGTGSLVGTKWCYALPPLSLLYWPPSQWEELTFSV